MIILSIDSATPVAAVAVIKDSVLLAEEMLNIGNTHSTQLMPMAAHVLAQSNIKMSEVDAVAVSQGPGSFTGLRIGMATAKGLAQGSGCKLIAVPTLDVLAQNMWGYDGLVCPILNAKKNEVYSALYRFDGAKMAQISDYTAISPENLAKSLANIANICFLGDGVPVYREMLSNILGERAKFAPADKLLSRGASLAYLAYEKAQRGEYAELFTTLPIYIRKCEAEINWELKHPGESVL